MEKSREEILAELNALNAQMAKKQHISDKKIIANIQNATNPTSIEKKKKTLNDPKKKKQRGERISRSLNTPESKAKMKASLAIAMSKIEVREKLSKSAQNYWNNLTDIEIQKIGEKVKKGQQASGAGQKISAALKGKTRSESAKQKTANKHRGMKRSNDTKSNISAALKGIPKEKYTCPICNKVGGIGIMKRWGHGPNCTKG